MNFGGDLEIGGDRRHEEEGCVVILRS
ncbi:hypothetical protein A2U01_0112301, partial [Trifolium medium]|nr:hypothetical protein [Trifolium medium]